MNLSAQELLVVTAVDGLRVGYAQKRARPIRSIHRHRLHYRRSGPDGSGWFVTYRIRGLAFETRLPGVRGRRDAIARNPNVLHLIRTVVLHEQSHILVRRRQFAHDDLVASLRDPLTARVLNGDRSAYGPFTAVWPRGWGSGQWRTEAMIQAKHRIIRNMVRLALRYGWSWGVTPCTPDARRLPDRILYIDTPAGQCSWHVYSRQWRNAPHYPRPWCGDHGATARALTALFSSQMTG